MTDCDNHEPIGENDREADRQGQAGVYHPVEAAVHLAKGAEIGQACLQLGANTAFLYWKRWEARMPDVPNLGAANELEWRAELETLRSRFEEQGHWRELDPNVYDRSDPERQAHTADKQQIETFIADRRSRVRYTIEYDDVRVVSPPAPHAARAKAPVADDWEFTLNGEPQLRLRVAGWPSGLPCAEPESEQVTPEGPPVGYAIFKTIDGLSGTVFFVNGACVALDPAFKAARGHCPDEYYHVGDYALRRKQKDALAEDVASMKKSLAGVEPLVRRIPAVLADRDDARAQPFAYAAELHNRIRANLEPEEQDIYGELMNHNKVQSHAYKAFKAKRKGGKCMSSTVFHRKAKAINNKLIEHDLGTCINPRSRPQGSRRSGGYVDDDGRTVPEEISYNPHDWTKDPEDRDRICAAYWGAAPEDREEYRIRYPDIEAEAAEYQRRQRAKEQAADKRMDGQSSGGLFRDRS